MIRETKAAERFGETQRDPMRKRDRDSESQREGRQEAEEIHRENGDIKEGPQRRRGPRHRDEETDTHRDGDVSQQ